MEWFARKRHPTACQACSSLPITAKTLRGIATPRFPDVGSGANPKCPDTCICITQTLKEQEGHINCDSPCV